MSLYATYNEGFYLGDLTNNSSGTAVTTQEEFITYAYTALRTYGVDFDVTGEPIIVGGYYNNGTRNVYLLVSLSTDGGTANVFPNVTDLPDMKGYVFRDNTSGNVFTYATDDALLANVSGNISFNGAPVFYNYIWNDFTTTTKEEILIEGNLYYSGSTLADVDDALTDINAIYGDQTEDLYVRLAAIHEITGARYNNLAFLWRYFSFGSATELTLVVTDSTGDTQNPVIEKEITASVPGNDENYFQLKINSDTEADSNNVEIINRSYVAGYNLKNLQVDISNASDAATVQAAIIAAADNVIGEYRPGFDRAIFNILNTNATDGAFYGGLAILGVSGTSGNTAETSFPTFEESFTRPLDLYDPKESKPFTVTEFGAESGEARITNAVGEYFNSDIVTNVIPAPSNVGPQASADIGVTLADVPIAIGLVALFIPNTIDSIGNNENLGFFYRRLATDSWQRLYPDEKVIFQDIRSNRYYMYSEEDPDSLILNERLYQISSASKLAEGVRGEYLQSGLRDNFDGSRYFQTESQFLSVNATGLSGYQNLSGDITIDFKLSGNNSDAFIIYSPVQVRWRYNSDLIDPGFSKAITFYKTENGLRTTIIVDIYKESVGALTSYMTTSFSTEDTGELVSIGTEDTVGFFQFNLVNLVRFIDTDTSGVNFNDDSGEATILTSGVYNVSGDIIYSFEESVALSITTSPLVVLRVNDPQRDLKTERAFVFPSDFSQSDNALVKNVSRSANISFSTTLSLDDGDTLSLLYYRANLSTAVRPALGYISTNSDDNDAILNYKCNFSIHLLDQA